MKLVSPITHNNLEILVQDLNRTQDPAKQIGTVRAILLGAQDFKDFTDNNERWNGSIIYRDQEEGAAKIRRDIGELSVDVVYASSYFIDAADNNRDRYRAYPDMDLFGGQQSPHGLMLEVHSELYIATTKLWKVVASKVIFYPPDTCPGTEQ